jgi:hypothetical protein
MQFIALGVAIGSIASFKFCRVKKNNFARTYNPSTDYIILLLGGFIGGSIVFVTSEISEKLLF